MGGQVAGRLEVRGLEGWGLGGWKAGVQGAGRLGVRGLEGWGLGGWKFGG